VRGAAGQRGVRSFAVVVIPEVMQLALEVAAAPERNVVKELATDRADQSLDKGVRQRYVGNALDFYNVENPEIRLPALEFEERIMVAAQRARRACCFADDLVEHPADGGSVRCASV